MVLKKGKELIELSVKDGRLANELISKGYALVKEPEPETGAKSGPDLQGIVLQNLVEQQKEIIAELRGRLGDEPEPEPEPAPEAKGPLTSEVGPESEPEPEPESEPAPESEPEAKKEAKKEAKSTKSAKGSKAKSQN